MWTHNRHCHHRQKLAHFYPHTFTNNRWHQGTQLAIHHHTPTMHTTYRQIHFTLEIEHHHPHMHYNQQLQSVVPAGTRTAEPVQQRMPLLTGNRTPLQTWDANSALQSLNAFSPPNHHRQKKGEYVSLLEDDSYELLEMSPPAAAQSNRKRSEDWESFASHFTTEFEALKGEVETLRAEVRQLKRALRDTKVN